MQYVMIEKEELEKMHKTQIEILAKIDKRGSNGDKLVSLEEAEKITGVEYQKLRQMYLAGEIAGKRFGRAIRLNKAALLDCGREK